MAAQGFVGGDPTKVDKVTVMDGPGVGLHFQLEHPDATAIQVDAENDQDADVVVATWVNNSDDRVQTGYLNEKGEVRVQPGSPATVPTRVKQRNALQTGDLQQWADNGNNVLSAIGPDGHARMRVEDWQALTLESGVSSDGAGVRLESAYGLARLRGRLETTAAGFGAGSPFAHLPAGYAPAQLVTAAIRFDSSNRTLNVGTDGSLSIDTSFGSGSNHVFHLDGVTWEIAP